MSLMNRIPSLFPELTKALSVLDEPLFTSFARAPGLRSSVFSRFRPVVDVSETDKNYIVEAELPGVRKEDLGIEITDDNTLILKGRMGYSRAAGAPPEGDVVNSSAEAEGKSDSTATSSASTETAVGQPDRTFWEQERFTGSFQRAFTFPGKIDPANVKASYKDGVLVIEVPKPETRVNKIEIN